MLEIPETTFWDADYSFLLGVVENKAAFDGWMICQLEKMRKEV